MRPHRYSGAGRYGRYLPRLHAAGAFADQAAEIGAKVVMQLEVRDDAAAACAEAAGLKVVMDRCPKIEFGRLFGELAGTVSIPG